MDWHRCIRLTKLQYNEKQLANVSQRIISYLVQIGDFPAMEHFIGVLSAYSVSYTSPNALLDVSLVFNSLKRVILSNAKYNMYPLMRCYEKGIEFGVNCQEAHILYSMVYQLIRGELRKEYSDNDNRKDFIAIDHGNVNYSFQSGQYIYTAVLLLWYTQGRINNHRCYECNVDWIDHMIKFDSHHRSSVDDAEYNNNNENQNGDLISLMLREKIENLVETYLPQRISIKDESKDGIDIFIPIDGACTSITKKCSHLIAQYLYSKAYACSFAAKVISAGDEYAMSTLHVHDKLKGSIGNNHCVINHRSIASGIDNPDDDKNANKHQKERMAKIGEIMKSGELDQFAQNVIGRYSGERKTQEFVLQRQSPTIYMTGLADCFEVCLYVTIIIISISVF